MPLELSANPVGSVLGVMVYEDQVLRVRRINPQMLESGAIRVDGSSRARP